MKEQLGAYATLCGRDRAWPVEQQRNTPMDSHAASGSDQSGHRLLAAAGGGAAATVLCGFAGSWSYAPVVGWLTGAAVFLSWTWQVIGRLDGPSTAAHATREDPNRATSHAVLVVASVASLAGVGYLLAQPSSGKGMAALAAALSLGSVAASWLTVNTLFTLRYARMYYTPPEGGISFGQQDPPTYADFAYMAFTLGMTYQVSDTPLEVRTVRASALRHALLSYLLGAIVLATAINLVAGLTGR
jgi:uncharacterized membrane protein